MNSAKYIAGLKRRAQAAVEVGNYAAARQLRRQAEAITAVERKRALRAVGWDKDLRRNIPQLSRVEARQQIEKVHLNFPGPYRLEGFSPFPAEAYGLPEDAFFQYETARIDREAAEHETVFGAYDQWRQHMESIAEKYKRAKIYILAADGRRVYIDSQVLDKARPLVVAGA